MSGMSLIVSSANKNENERFMAHEKSSNNRNIKNQNPCLRHSTRMNLQTPAHAGDKVIKWLSVAKYEQNKYSYWHRKEMLLQEKPAWFTPNPCVQLLMTQKVWPALKQEVTARSCKLTEPPPSIQSSQRRQELEDVLWACTINLTWNHNHKSN